MVEASKHQSILNQNQNVYSQDQYYHNQMQDHFQVNLISEGNVIQSISQTTPQPRKKSAKFIMEQQPKNEIISSTQLEKAANKSLRQQPNILQNRIKNPYKSMKIEMGNKTEEAHMKRVLIIYTSGAAGANENVQIIRDYLRTKIAENQYFSDYKMQENLQDRSFLVTPQQQNGMRLLYKVEEFSNIALSINVTYQIIKQIAEKIHKNYKKYDAFIVLCGLDTICYVATLISFMLENLSKLIIFTGGYFPISYMRNDTVNNLIESFAIISLAENFHDVIIVSKNKGYRANRCIKMKEGDLNAISSPNIDALVSVNIKIKFRQYLFLPMPTEQFRIWTDLSLKVGVIRFDITLSKQALQYMLLNPAYQGFVVQTYAANNLPDNLQILNIFKRIAQEKGKVYVTTSQSIYKANNSLKREYLQQFYIYFGGDMTTEAAVAKLAYLFSKNYSKTQIKKLLHTNMRGQLTEVQSQNHFSFQNYSFMEIVTKSIQEFYPTNLYGSFINKIQDHICNFIVKEQTPKDIELLFKKTLAGNVTEENYSQILVELANRNYLVHKAVKCRNQNLYKYFLSFNVDVNHLDQFECSPLFYAVSLKDRKAIVYLSKKGGSVICPTDQLFEMIVKEIKEDNLSFFQLLYHIEFKQTLPQETNNQGRNSLHLCAILGAQKCIKYLLEKFKFNIKVKDIYGKMYIDYKKNN